MRANYRMQRLFVPQPMVPGGAVDPDPQQAHYLLNVLRLKPGSQLLVFNGMDGEWLAETAEVSRKEVRLSLMTQVRPQPAPSDLLYCFAPLKQGRLDYMVQKAVEMGAGKLQPVITQHTQMSTIGVDRIRANAIEERRLGLLIGPEGGFSDEERRMLRALPYVTPIPLGPRILRADTAAVAALAVIQATIGDWR